jgi:hypothetical protein
MIMDQSLLLSKPKGSFAHHGMQPPGEATASTSVLSLSSTLLNVPLSSSASLKRKHSPFDISSTRSSFSVSSKRKRPLSNVDKDFQVILEKINLHLDQAPVAAPAPLLQVKAVQSLLKIDKESKERGDQWTSADELIAVTNIFLHNATLAGAYLTFISLSDEETTRKWVWGHLTQN